MNPSTCPGPRPGICDDDGRCQELGDAVLKKLPRDQEDTGSIWRALGRWDRRMHSCQLNGAQYDTAHFAHSRLIPAME